MARSWNRLYFCCVALGAAICLFARFCAGRRCCYRTAVPSMRLTSSFASQREHCFQCSLSSCVQLVVKSCPRASPYSAPQTVHVALWVQVAVPPWQFSVSVWLVSRLQIRVWVFSSLFCVQVPQSCPSGSEDPRIPCMSFRLCKSPFRSNCVTLGNPIPYYTPCM